MAEVVERRSRSVKKTIYVEKDEYEDGDGDDVAMRMVAISLKMTMLGIMWLATNSTEMISIGCEHGLEMMDWTLTKILVICFLYPHFQLFHYCIVPTFN